MVGGRPGNWQLGLCALQQLDCEQFASVNVQHCYSGNTPRWRSHCYTLYCHNVHCTVTLYTVHCIVTLHAVHCTVILYSVHYLMISVHCRLSSHRGRCLALSGTGGKTGSCLALHWTVRIPGSHWTVCCLALDPTNTWQSQSSLHSWHLNENDCDCCQPVAIDCYSHHMAERSTLPLGI